MFIPPAPAPVPDLRIDPNILRSTWQIIAEARKSLGVFRARGGPGLLAFSRNGHQSTSIDSVSATAS